MASRTDGETQDERSILIDVACRRAGSKWKPILADQLEESGTWLPWMVLWTSGSAWGSRGYLAEPGPTDLRAVAADVKTFYGVPAVSVAKINLAGRARTGSDGYLLEYARTLAARYWADEAQWPKVDDGPADWLA